MSPHTTTTIVRIAPLRTLAEFKRRLATCKYWHVRHFHTRTWSPRTVVKLQSNAVAFAKSFDPDIVAVCTANPHRNASWHWWGKASSYRPSPDCEGTIRVLIGTSWDDPHGGWMEFRPADP